MLFPYKGNKLKVSQPYTLGVHNGLDLVGQDSKEICAIGSGVVTVAQYHYSMGNFIRIFQDDGLYVTYMHLSEFEVDVGNNIDAGDIIGIEGSTGNSTGSHLHIQIETQGDIIHTSSHSAVVDVSEYTNIPNAYGYYEREENMTKDEINTLIDEKIKNLASKTEVDIAITNAIRSNNNELIEKLSQKVYHTWDEIKDELPWAYDDLLEMHKLGVFSGNSNTDLGVTKSEIKSLVWMYRLDKNK